MSLTTEREKAAHLLRRFGLGASQSELDYYLSSGGLEGAKDKLLNFEKVDEVYDISIEDLAIGGKNVNMPSVQAWWTAKLLTTRKPLQEKMTLFWHDHFATSAAKVNSPAFMYDQNLILRKKGLSKFETLLTEASKDPAMLFWLDNQYNVAGKPNENFAREVMELFTLGIGHYTEQDIQEAARAFTGWTLIRDNSPYTIQGAGLFLFSPSLHDNGSKKIFGKTGNFTGEEVLSMLCQNPRTAEYITEKMWSWFAYPNPDPELLARKSKVFFDSGLDIKVLVRAIMDSPEFYSSKAERAIYKNPVDFIVVTLRQLGVGETYINILKDKSSGRPRRPGPIIAVQQNLKSMGMELLYPPDVAGWDGGPAWISSATMIERIGWADVLFGPPGRQGKGKKPSLGLPIAGLVGGDATAEQIADFLVETFDAPIPSAKRPQLVAAATKGLQDGIGPQRINNAAIGVSRLIFSSPEFQFC